MFLAPVSMYEHNDVTNRGAASIDVAATDVGHELHAALNVLGAGGDAKSKTAGSADLAETGEDEEIGEDGRELRTQSRVVQLLSKRGDATEEDSSHVSVYPMGSPTGGVNWGDPTTESNEGDVAPDTGAGLDERKYKHGKYKYGKYKYGKNKRHSSKKYKHYR